MDKKLIDVLVKEIKKLPFDEKVSAINYVREKLHKVSPFRNEPVDYVMWVKSDRVVSNDYNPNKVAPPEMELLEISITNDGYTQPIVTWPTGSKSEVVDGFHRSRVGKESETVRKKLGGYLPTVVIRKKQESKNDRIASTIRHNRARGKHQIDAMSEIVLELKNRNWTNKRISKELGMDEEEILRLCQITGLEYLFTDADFSKAWESDDSFEYEPISDAIGNVDARTVNTSDPGRIFHTFDKWECVNSGFYDSTVDGMNKEEAEKAYAEFLRNSTAFRRACSKVIVEWKHSCEHYLTNRAMNRVAWMGQAAAAYAKGLPSVFCGGFGQLTKKEQDEANKIALNAINRWMVKSGRKKLTMEEAYPVSRQMDIY